MTENEVDYVLQHGCLLDDTLWTIPIVLDVRKDHIEGIANGDMFGLVYNGTPTATLGVEDIYENEENLFAESVFRYSNAKIGALNSIMYHDCIAR